MVPALAIGGVDSAVGAQAFVFFQANIDDAGIAFGLVFGARVGNDIDAIDLFGGQALKVIGEVLAGQRQPFPVDVNQYAGAAKHGDIVVVVNRHRRGFAQESEAVRTNAVDGTFHVEHGAVGLDFHQGAVCGNGGFGKPHSTRREAQHAQIESLAFRRPDVGLVEVLQAQIGGLEVVGFGGQVLHLKQAGIVAGFHFDQGAVGCPEKGNAGKNEGLSFRILQLAGKGGALGLQRKNETTGQGNSVQNFHFAMFSWTCR